MGYKLALLGAAALWLSSIPAQAAPKAQSETLHSRGAVVVFSRDGSYSVTSAASHVKLNGRLPEPAASLRIASGSDGEGTYREIVASYAGGARTAAIRLYLGGAAVLFIDTYNSASANAQPFPDFHLSPQNLMRASYRVSAFSPIDFGRLDAQGPWLLFDRERNTVVLSPADNFLVSDLAVAPDGEMQSGIDRKIATLPAGFRHRTLVVFGQGVNRTLAEWGAALQRLGGKQPVPNDADVVLNQFGYWTDNGSSYYYKFDRSLGHEGTLLAVRDRYRSLGAPIAYLQLDSWWYPKEAGNTLVNGTRDNGAVVYRADPAIFPDGLDAFHRKLGLPMATHARWISAASPYRKQYEMSNDVIVDPRFWRSIAEYLSNGGVAVYEQDWLSARARPAIDIAQAHEFLANMSGALSRVGIGIQYCMALPGYFLASTQFQNVRTIRVSDDRFQRSRYDSFLYTSALARAVGLWPWSDAFRSGELPNLILSTLSAGPVGVGDSLDAIDADNLRRVMRSDSVILKPDASLVPIDEMYLEDAAAGGRSPKPPMVAMAETRFAGATERYIFSYSRSGGEAGAAVPLRELGVGGAVYAWDWRTHKGELLSPGESLHVFYEDGWGYEVLAPVSRSGVALLGDASKIAPLARKRFTAVSDDKGAVEATLAFAPEESSVAVTGYARRQPHLSTSAGTIRDLRFDSATHLFTVNVLPGAGARATIRIR